MGQTIIGGGAGRGLFSIQYRCLDRKNLVVGESVQGEPEEALELHAVLHPLGPLVFSPHPLHLPLLQAVEVLNQVGGAA